MANSFSRELNAYCMRLGCTSKTIAEKCGLSASALSRYRRGGRIPLAGSDTVKKLAAGLAVLFVEQGSDNAPTEQEIFDNLSARLDEPIEQARQFCERLDQIMSELHVRNAEMARHVGIDPSYLSRIRSGQRVPGDPSKLANSCSKLLARRAIAMGVCENTCKTVGADEVFTDTRRLSKVIVTWLCGSAKR